MLERSVTEGRLRHASLLVGPARVGKAEVARWLATRLNCLGASPPCGVCRTCHLIAAGTHPDVRAVQLAADRDSTLGLAFDVPQASARGPERAIGIAQIRALQHDASLAPHEGRWKVYLIVGAESLSPEAANCLLKTLEEPPARVVLILTCVDQQELLPTVVSRCQVVRLTPVPWPTIAAALEADHGCDPERASLLARLSGGRPGWAIEAATRPAELEERTGALRDLEETLRPGYRERLGVAERLATDYSRDQGKVLRTLASWQLVWWDVLLIQRGCADLITSSDREDLLRSLAAQIPRPAVEAQVRNVGLAARRLIQNVNPRLALEALLVSGPVV
ncbi:MAG: ATP-binding protein [Chloroflexota bacterium]